MEILIIIPARGGSKGIPRKNIRPLNGKPLLYYAINNSQSINYSADIYVSSDDDEILAVAKTFNCNTHKRTSINATDLITLDPVIFECLTDIEAQTRKCYDIVITLQPTSPLLKVSTLNQAIKLLQKEPELDTVISVQEDKHLTWSRKHNTFIPNYTERLNRQELPENYKETGGFLITRRKIISQNNRIGEKTNLVILDEKESIDIDTYKDWYLCEFYLKRKTILFVVKGNKQIGMGHVYNTLSIAHELLEHEVIFLVDTSSHLAFQKISSLNYLVYMQSSDDILDDINKISPDIIINDILKTSYEYMKALKESLYTIINFEDNGEGSKLANLVINAIYSEKKLIPNHYYGHNYFILRDEFLYPNTFYQVKNKIRNVLLTFGGTDPNNYTYLVTSAIYDYCQSHNIRINIVAGIGYQKYNTLKPFPLIKIHKDITNISKYMYNSDLIFSSCGRTTYEIASIGVPCIVIAQNQRELTHSFPYGENGFINLGLGYNLKEKDILDSFIYLVNNLELRQQMSISMKENNLRTGKKNVLNLLRKEINNHEVN